MTDGITVREDGYAEMAYAGAVPWHGLGNVLLPDDDRETRIKKAGFDFTIKAGLVHYTPEDSFERTMSDRRVLYRSDNEQALSIVSNVFKVVQPFEVMDYFEELSQKAGFKLETAGTLFGGRQFWALANIGDESFVLDPKDRIKGRLLMATSVDLTLPTTLKFLAERVVCANTLSWGLRETGGSEVKVKHNSTFNPKEVNEQLGILAHGGFMQTIDALRRTADTAMSDSEMLHATATLIKPAALTLDDDEFVRLMNSRPVQRIAELAIEERAIGAELGGAHGTAWGWLNAVTQFVDHESRAQTADGRLSRAWFGAGERLKGRAFAMACAFAEGGAAEAPAEAADAALAEVLAD